MINLTNNNGQAARAMGEGSSSQARLAPRSHHNWGSSYGRRRNELKDKEPTTLTELEEQAKKAAILMNKYGGKPEKNLEVATSLLRQQYNMNFVIVCEKCKGTHHYDEIIAPER